MKNLTSIMAVLSLAGILACYSFASITLTSCAGQSASEVLTSAQSAAWTAANALETANTATGGVFTTAIVDATLKATHNTGDEAVVNAAAVVANKAIAAQAAAKTAGVSPSGIQAITTAVLSDPGVIQAAANAVQPSTSSNWKSYKTSNKALADALSGKTRQDMESSSAKTEVCDANADRFKIDSGIRPRHGWKLADNVY